MHLQDRIPDFDVKIGESVLTVILPLDANQMNESCLWSFRGICFITPV